MAKTTDSQEWAQGSGVVRHIHEKLEFIAFFDTQKDAESAAVEAGGGCEVCWVTYREGVGFRPAKASED